ncbi:MAG: tripartite tricarboxylate transporter TctB family protein [Chloroflexi bacterium]|nr:tripartite tricarboxylate transporter TctB family protein [Chloroflexota bacterium]
MSRKKADLVFSIFIVLMLVWMVWDGRGWELKARLFPWTIGLPAIALALLQLGLAVRGVLKPEPQAEGGGAAAQPSRPIALEAAEAVPRSSGEAIVAAAVESAFGAGSAAAEEEELPAAMVRQRTLHMSVWILVFCLGVAVLGFKIGAALLSLAFMRFAAHEKWKLALAISLATYFFFYFVFDYSLNVPFPNGWLADWLGLDALDSYIMNPIVNALRG